MEIFCGWTEETKQKISFTVREKNKQIVLSAPRSIKIGCTTDVSFNPDSKVFFSGTKIIYFGWLEVEKTFSSKRKFLAPTNEILFVSWYLKHEKCPSYVGSFLKVRQSTSSVKKISCFSVEYRLFWSSQVITRNFHSVRLMTKIAYFDVLSKTTQIVVVVVVVGFKKKRGLLF